MTSRSDKLSGEHLERIMRFVITADSDGLLTEQDRLSIYKLALTVAAEEFHRILANGGADAVDPNVLLLLQQVAILGETDAESDEDSGHGIEDAS